MDFLLTFKKLSVYLLTFCCTFLAPVATWAENKPIQWKISSEFAFNGEFGNSFGWSGDIATTYFMDAINYSDGPYAEQEFLNPVNAVHVRLFHEKATNSIDDASGSLLSFGHTRVINQHIFTPRVFYSEYEDLTTIGTGLDYQFLMNDTSRFFAGASINNEELADGSSIATTMNTGYRKLWIYGKRALAVKGFWEFSHAENEQRSFSISTVGSELDFYINKRWGIGAGISRSTSELERHRTLKFDLSTQYYFSNNLDLHIGAELESIQEGTYDVKAALGLKYYF